MLTNNADLSNEDEVKNIIKYNGQDYLVKSISGKYTSLRGNSTRTTIHSNYDPEKYEAEQSAEGITQIMLAVDCSYSMRNETTIVDGNEMSKLEVAVNSSKKLINQLLDNNINIYIGLIFFSGTNYRAVSLTKNKDELELALNDIISNNWLTANTDVTSTLDKAVKSFYTENNRYIILISDGFPTKATTNNNVIETYYDDSNAVIEDKLEKIKNITKAKISNIINQNIKFISLLTLPENDNETRDFVKSIYADGYEGNENLIFKMISEDSQELENTIKDEIKDYIIEESVDNIKENATYIPAIGYEDYKRYKKIVNNFKFWNLTDANLFHLIDNYTENNQEQVKDFSNKLYGHAYGGHYDVGEQYSEAPETEYTYDTNNNITNIKKYVVNHTGYSETMLLAKRPAFSLDLNVDVTGLQITLTNGIEYINKQKEDLNNEVLMATLDEDLAYGSEVEVTYTISIKNETKMPYSDLQVICYLPKKITVKADNSKGYKVEKISIENYYNQGLIGENPYQEYRKNKQAVLLTLHLDSTEDFKKTINTYEFKLNGSMRISKIDDLADVTCISEILSYSNYMEYLDTQKQQLPQQNPENNRYVLIDDEIRNSNNINEENVISMSRRLTAKSYSGNSLLTYYSSTYPANDVPATAEIDYDESSEVPVIPPTGLTNKMKRKAKILRYSLVTLIILAILIIISLKKSKK